MAVILIYVDDIIIAWSESIYINYVVKLMNYKFAFKLLGALNFFLGLEVTKTTAVLHLSQHKYIK